MRNSKRNAERISYQTVEGAVEGADVDTVETTEEKKSTFVKEGKNCEIHKGEFEITVKSDEIDPATKEKKVLYTNKAENFEYEKVRNFPELIRHAGGQLNDEQIGFLGSALVEKDAEGNETEASKATGKAIQSFIGIYNAKQKADAKSAAYQALVNKYKPLEGEKKESAQARLVANFIKLAGVSKETAIDTLKMGKALPEDYTVADFDATPLRRSKTDNEDE